MSTERLKTTEQPDAAVNVTMRQKAKYEVTAKQGITTSSGSFAKGEIVELDHDGSRALLNEGSIKEAKDD